MQQTITEKRSSLLDLPFGLTLNWETVIWVLIVAVGTLLRFWDLGPRGLHHDESIHAVYSWYILSGKGAYLHNPTYHGPFLYYATALSMFLFGATSYATRIMPAIFGSLLIVSPLLVRKWLGRTGAILVALMLTISPSILYYSRALRHDIFSLCATVYLFIAFWRYLDERKLGWVYFAALVYTIGYLNHELMLLITTPLFGIGLVAILAVEWLQKGGERPTLARLQAIPARTWLICLLIFLAFFLPLITSLFTNMPGLASGTIAAATYWFSQQPVQRGTQPWYYYIFMLSVEEYLPVIFAFPGIIMILRRKEVRTLPMTILVIVAFVLLLFLLSLYSLPPVLVMIVLLAAGIWLAGYWGRPDNLVPTYLVFWAVISFAAYSYAGEKMPWLTAHMAAPLIFITGWYLERILAGISWRALWERGAIYLVVLVPLILIACQSWLGLQPATGGQPTPVQNQTQQWLALLIILGGLIAALVYLVRQAGPRLSLQAGLIGFLGLLLVLTFRTGYMASFTFGDIARDPLIYVQTSPDVTNVAKRIEALSQRLTSGKDMVVIHDDECSWPFTWYLKDFPKSQYIPKGPTSPPDAPVVLVGLVNDDKVKPLMGKYTRTHLKLRWWFPEYYKSPVELAKFFMDEEEVKRFDETLRKENRQATWGDALQAALSPTGRYRLGRFFFFRDLWELNGQQTASGQLGSTDFVVYVKKELSDSFWAGSVTIPKTAAAAPEVDPYEKAQRIVSAVATFGSRGVGDGQFVEPKDVTLDSEGNIYVADTLNHRIQKFDKDGKFLMKFGGQCKVETGAPCDGLFNEPWGVAVDREGNIYVADTWNHRVQKFDKDGKFVAKWGSFVDIRGNTAQTSVFYGPRDLVIDSDGNLLVADTGNKRVQKFDKDGKFLGQVGVFGTELGQFNEPVGLALGPNGDLFVADTWNRRIQRLTPAAGHTFTAVTQWPFQGWESESVLNKPYLAVDKDGNVYASDPEMHRLVKFSGAGQVLAVFGKPGNDPASFNLPVGLALDAEGNLFVADAFNNRIVKLPPVK